MGYHPKKFSCKTGGNSEGLDSFYFPSLGFKRRELEVPVVELEEQVTLYLSSKGSSKVVGGPPYRLMELNKLKWFWKNLGLNKQDLLEMNNDWVQEMYSVGLTVDTFASTKSSEPIGAERVVGNKLIKKLL